MTIFPLWPPSLPATFDSWWSGLSPEFHLLLACLRLAPSELEIRQIAGFCRRGLNWPGLVSLVDRHRTAPLVYQNLKRHGHNVPASIMSSLRSRVKSNAHRSLANATELVRLYKLFQENHIPSISLKGSALALQVYGNLALRHAGDIDLLVAPPQVELADQLLRPHYRRLVPSSRLTPSQLRQFSKVMHHFEYLHNRGNLSLELHWRPIRNLSPACLDFSQILDRASVVTIVGTPLPVFSLTDNLLYLSGHGGHHFWSKLFWLVDLAEIIRQHHTIDWRQVMSLAKAAGLLHQLVLGAVLAHKLLDAPLPEAIRTHAWRDPLVAYQAQVSCRYLLCPDPEDRPLSLRLHLFACNLRVANSLPEKLIYIQDFLAGKDWMTRGLPDFLFFFYFLTRFPLWLQQNLHWRRHQLD
jgi:hypothetical protein